MLKRRSTPDRYGWPPTRSPPASPRPSSTPTTETDPRDRRQAVAHRWREIHAPQPSIPAPAKAPDSAQDSPHVRRKLSDPVVEAVVAAERALERLDKALMDENATLRRAAVDAEHLQKRLRKVGRILAKVIVPSRRRHRRGDRGGGG